MALFKINKGTKANLPNKYVEGYCYFTTDEGKFYIDTSNASTGRILLNAGKADTLATARTISLTGDVTGSASFDGSANASITATVADDSHSHSNYTPYETKSATTAATAGWYRIATSISNIGNCNAIFSIIGYVDGFHTTATIMAGTSYGHGDGSQVSVLQCSNFSSAAITKARIVYHTSYNNNYAYLEVYNPNAKAITITVKMVNSNGWTLVAPNTAGSIPSGYSNKEITLVNATISAEKFAGSGASLTSLNASNISSGTIAAARLPAATTSTQGAMTAAMVTKLNGIAAGANAYTLPTASSTLGGVKTTSTVTSTSGLTACPIISGVVYYKDTNTTYSAGTGISLSGTTFSNSGVHSITTGSTNGTISVNTNGTSADVAVKGLGSNAYTSTGLAIAQAAQPGSQYVLWVDTDEDSAEAMRADAIKYKTFSIATTDWSGSGPYTYTMTATGITVNSAIINLTLDATSQTYQKAQLDWETGSNQIILSTATKPTGTIAGYLIATDVTVI